MAVTMAGDVMRLVRTRPERALRVEDLPERIRGALVNAGQADGFRYALKTALKPNATVPIVWAVITSNALLCCTTHAKRGVWRKYGFAEVNSVRVSATRLDIVSSDIDTPDLGLPLPDGTERAWVNEFMRAYETARVT